MAEASTSKLPTELSISVSFAGRTTSFRFDATASHLSDLHTALYDAFSVPPSAQKLIAKGKRLPLDGSVALSSLVPANGAKIMLVGTPERELEGLKDEEALRQRKREAFAFHSTHKAPAVRSTASPGGESTEQYRFHVVKPFPPEIPSLEARKKMLDRLAEDPAIREIMIKHKYVVGTLTELHPHLQPTLLGLNKNGGQEICLRLLTDRLDGTRPYLNVRAVLIHELTHNEISPHDNSFKELNSLLTKEVNAFESSRGLRIGQQAAEPWEPTGGDAEPTAHRLDEPVRLPSARQLLRMAAEDEVEERRERTRKAAEARRRQAH